MDTQKEGLTDHLLCLALVLPAVLLTRAKLSASLTPAWQSQNCSAAAAAQPLQKLLSAVPCSALPVLSHRASGGGRAPKPNVPPPLLPPAQRNPGTGQQPYTCTCQGMFQFIISLACT